MDADVLVIGGGYGGLATGALLAHSGHQVLLLEKSSMLGGRASYMERDGFLLDYGLHDNRFAGSGPAAALFRRLGKELEFIELDQPLLFDDGDFQPIPNSLPKIVRSRSLAFMSKIRVASYFARLLLGRTEKKYGVSLEEFLSRCPSDELKELFSMLSGIGLIAPDLSNASTGEFASFIKKALKAKVKVGYPRGGTCQIIEGLKREIEENGQILLNSAVERLSLKKSRITQVHTKNTSYSAEVVVCSVPVQQVPPLFGGKDLPINFVKYAKSAIPTAGITLDLALSEPVSELRGLIVTSQPLTMGQFTSNIDPSTAPEGKQLVSWFYPLPAQWMKNRERLEKEESRLRSLLSQMFPKIWDKMEWERLMRLPMVDGFLPKPGQTPLERPGYTIKNIDNLFLAGDTTCAPGSGGDVAFNSALEVVPLIQGYLEGKPSAD